MRAGNTLSNNIQDVIRNHMKLYVGDQFDIFNVKCACIAQGMSITDTHDIRGALDFLYNSKGYIEKVNKNTPDGIYEVIVDPSHWNIL